MYRCSTMKVIVRHVYIMLDFVPTAAILMNISLQKTQSRVPFVPVVILKTLTTSFFLAPPYIGSRFELYNQLFAYRPLTDPLLLFGLSLLTKTSNSNIFKCVHNYLRHRKAFSLLYFIVLLFFLLSSTPTFIFQLFFYHFLIFQMDYLSYI